MFGATSTFNFGPPQAVQQPLVQPQQSVQQLIQDTTTLVKSVSGPEVFNDDRNEVIAKLNQLLAAYGVGQGYYKEGQQPVNYTENNLFYRFKGVVYNRMCRHTEEDGLVVLILNVPISQVNTNENKIIEDIDTVFGLNAGVKCTLDNISAEDDKKTAVTITAYEQNKGRVVSTNLFKFLTQPDKMSILKSKLMCEKVFPLVASSRTDREKFLNCPPDGFDANLWRQGVRSNPDPERFLPQPIYGFEKLGERRRMQANATGAQSTVLNENVERLKKIESDVSRFKSHLQNNKRYNRELVHRFLRLAIHLLQEMRKGYALNKVEDKILAQAERADVNLTGPDALKDRINDVLKLMDNDRQKVSDYFRGIDTNFTAEESLILRQHLQSSQQQLEKVAEMLDDIRKVLEIVERKR